MVVELENWIIKQISLEAGKGALNHDKGRNRNIDESSQRQPLPRLSRLHFDVLVVAVKSALLREDADEVEEDEAPADGDGKEQINLEDLHDNVYDYAQLDNHINYNISLVRLP